MAYWDAENNQIVRFPPEPVEDYPGWLLMDCGCCNGIEWGGETPRECRDCGGGGYVFKHKKSGVLAQYPGGPFCGSEAPVAAVEEK